jgi:hypothetical protein
MGLCSFAFTYKTDSVPVRDITPIFTRNPKVLDNNVDGSNDGKSNCRVARRSYESKELSQGVCASDHDNSRGIGSLGAVTASATAAQAETEGAPSDKTIRLFR